MPYGKLSEKEKKIKKEVARLKKVYEKIDENKKKVVASLIADVAFMIISLQELQEDINAMGYTSEYQNGENQHGTKKSPEVEIYLQMSKNHAAAIKQLTELAPLAPKKEKSKLQKLAEEFAE